MTGIEDRFQVGVGLSSPEASLAIREFFQEQAGLLIAGGIERRWVEQGKENFVVEGMATDAEPGSEEWERLYAEREEQGAVEEVTVRRDLQSGRVSMALMQRSLPAELSGEGPEYYHFKADTVTARFQFPGRHSLEETPRVVLDTWRSPLTHLSRLGAVIGSRIPTQARVREYDRVFHSIFDDHDGSGVPLGSIAVTHEVFGGRGWVSEDSQTRLVAVLTDVQEGVQQGIQKQKFLNQVDPDRK